MTRPRNDRRAVALGLLRAMLAHRPDDPYLVAVLADVESRPVLSVHRLLRVSRLARERTYWARQTIRRGMADPDPDVAASWATIEAARRAYRPDRDSWLAAIMAEGSR